MTLLVGAFHPEDCPREQRRLSLDIAPRGALSRAIREACVVLDGTIHAEGLTGRAQCVCTAVRRGRAVRLAVDFFSDDGEPWSLVAELPLRPWTSPKLTELRGHVARRGERLGPVTLRIDWRKIARV